MAGTKAGWLHAKATMIERLGGEEAYLQWRKDMSRKGGKTPSVTPKGFAAMPREKVSEAGRRGGGRPRVRYVRGEQL